jgi:hypothetical protein
VISSALNDGLEVSIASSMGEAKESDFRLFVLTFGSVSNRVESSSLLSEALFTAFCISRRLDIFARDLCEFQKVPKGTLRKRSN